MGTHKTTIRRGCTNIHRNQAIVKHFNRTLAERLFGHQYAVEMRLPEGQRSTAWVRRPPEVVAALNNEVTRLTGKKPALQCHQRKSCFRKTLDTLLFETRWGKGKKPPCLVNVRYLFHPGELEGGGERATDPIWSLKVFRIERSVTKPNELVQHFEQSTIIWLSSHSSLKSPGVWPLHLFQASH